MVRRFVLTAPMLVAAGLLGADYARPATPKSPTPPDTTRLALAIGPAFQTHSDRLASPFHQSGTGFSLGMSFRRGGLTLALRGGIASTSSSFDELGEGGEDVWAGDLRVRYLRPVAEPWGAKFSIGASLAGVASVRRHTYPDGTDEFFADLAVPLSLAAEITGRLGQRTSVAASADVGVVSVLFRSPFAGTKDFPDPEVAAPWDSNVFRGRLELSRSLGPRFALGLAHELTFLTADRHRSLRVLHQSLSVEAAILLGGAP